MEGEIGEDGEMRFSKSLGASPPEFLGPSGWTGRGPNEERMFWMGPVVTTCGWRVIWGEQLIGVEYNQCTNVTRRLSSLELPQKRIQSVDVQQQPNALGLAANG